MAAWQFDYRLLPKVGVEQVHGTLPISIGRTNYDFASYWGETTLSPELCSQIGSILPPLESWSACTRRWGSEDGDRIDVVIAAGKIADLLVRTDVRSVSFHFVLSVLRMAQHHEWLVACCNGRVYLPEPRRILSEIQTSSAFQFAVDPTEFLRQLQSARDKGDDFEQ